MQKRDAQNAVGPRVPEFSSNAYANLRVIQSDIDAMSRVIREAMRPSSAIQEMLKSIDSQRRLVESFTIPSGIAAKLAEMESVTKRASELMAQSLSVASFVRLDQLTVSFRPPEGFSALIEEINSRVRLDSQLLKPTLSAFQDMQRAFEGEAYSQLFTQWPQPLREHCITIDLVREMAGVERDEGLRDQQTAADLEIEEHAHVTLPSSLRLLDPDLVGPWEGAWQALRSNNPDRVRHALISARELITHVLHLLAPDERVHVWTAKPEHFHNGKPTRKARLEYILAELSSTSLREFLGAEIKSAVVLIETLNNGTHSLSPNFSDAEAKILLRKAHCILCTLVEAKTIRLA